MVDVGELSVIDPYDGFLRESDPVHEVSVVLDVLDGD